MYERRYYHAEVTLSENGRLVCQACGAEVDKFLRSPQPCRYPTSAVTLIGELPICIHVSNLRATLIAEIPTSASTVKIVVLAPDEDIADELDDLLVTDVENQGGLNISGFYTLSDETAQKVDEWLRTGKLRLQM
jgi:hypothetical protein